MKRAVLLFTAWSALVVGCLSSQTLTPCRAWSEAREAGKLDEDLIDEASGLDFSRVDPERLYHINDSGDGGRFFATRLDGSETASIDVDGFDPVDTEDLTVGACGPEGGACLFIADIGDNQTRRQSTEIVVVPEPESLTATVVPRRRFRIRYPDGPQDAESLAIHPNGDLFILTKTIDYARLRVAPSVVYRVRYEDWSEGAGVHDAERLGELALYSISSDALAGSLVTAMDITDDGRRFLVLTALNAFEFYHDLASGTLWALEQMREGVDYREIPLTALEQQESIAYLPSGGGFLYTTEAGSPDGIPIMRVDCLD